MRMKDLNGNNDMYSMVLTLAHHRIDGRSNFSLSMEDTCIPACVLELH